MFKWKYTIVVLTFLSSQNLFGQMESIYKDPELDREEAHLNKHWKRVEEIGTAHGQFKNIREKEILGAYKAPMEAWFKDIDLWLKSWDTIIPLLSGDALADEDDSKAAMDSVARLAERLETLTKQIAQIRAKGESAGKSLAALPTFPGDYIDVVETSQQDSYASQIKIYNDSVAEAKSALAVAQQYYALSMTETLKTMTKKLDDAIVLKIKALAVRFPQIRAKVAEIEKTLVQIRVVDSLVAFYKIEEAAISKLIIEQKIFTAERKLAVFKVDLAKEIQKLESNRDLDPALKQYGKNTFLGLTGPLDRQIQDQLRIRSKIQIFASFYEKEMNSPFGLVATCLKNPEQKKIDCNRLRLIQGFNRTTLPQINEKAAEFMEGQILKAKGIDL